MAKKLHAFLPQNISGLHILPSQFIFAADFKKNSVGTWKPSFHTFSEGPPRDAFKNQRNLLDFALLLQKSS